MERLIEILEEIQPGIDYHVCKDLIDGRYIDSLGILSLISEIEEEYDITIPTVDIIPENFNSAESIWRMIVRISKED